MPTSKVQVKPITAEELYRMPDVDRCELVEGKIVNMAPSGDEHGAIEARVVQALLAYADRKGEGKVRSGEVGSYIRRNPDTVRAADALYISNRRYEKLTSSGYLDVAPELVVEVLSPQERWSDVTQKLSDYFEAGVVAVWVIDPKTPGVFVYRSLSEVQHFSKEAVLVDEEILPGFSLPVAEILRT